MSGCHWDRTTVLQQVHGAKGRLDAALLKQPVNTGEVQRLQSDLLRASEALARLPDCSD